MNTERAKELVAMLSEECMDLSEVQSMLKGLFKNTIEAMLNSELDEHLGYEKNSVLGNNSGNILNGYNKKTLKTELGETKILVPRDRNATFEPQVIEKRQTRILAMYAKGTES